MMNDVETDEQLLLRFRAGDSQAFNTLVRRHQDRVYRLASVWLHDQQQAWDAAQEVFLRGHSALQGFGFRSSVFTWVYRTTRNVCHEFNRKRRNETLDYEVLDVENGPLQQVDQQQAAIRIRKLVRDLPQRQREVVMLRLFEELSVTETADIMRCREGTVKALLHKATTKLRQWVAVEELPI